MQLKRAIPRISLATLCALAACAKSDMTPRPDSAAAMAAMAASAPAIPVIRITARDYAYDAPDTITAGMVTLSLTNNGPELHHVQLMRLTGGKTFADLAAGVKTMAPGAPMPPWIEVVAGPNSPAPGGEWSITEELTPGNYAIICLIPSVDHRPHFTKGMMRALTVIPATGQTAAAPITDINVTMTDYAWEVTPSITAGKHMIRLENSATQPHEMFIVRLAKGKTPLDVAVWGENPKGPPPAMPLGGTSGMRMGDVVYVPVDLTPGEYALICFIPDAKTGKPHYVHGMLKQFKVS